MRVKIGNAWHDSAYEPLMVELDQGEREALAGMEGTTSNFCAFPDGSQEEDIIKFMEIPADAKRNELPCIQSGCWH